MSRASKLQAVLEPLLRKVECGTQDHPRKLARLDVAAQRAEDIAGAGQLPTDGERGGTSLPEDVDDRKDAERVKRQAERDVAAFKELSARIETDAKELARITDRYAEVISDTKRPLTALPGCRSCARKEDVAGVTMGGQWAPVDEKGIGEGLCRQCVEFKNATGGLPPVKWCHLRHTQGAKAANRWLATEFPRLLESVQRKAKNQRRKNGITADDLTLRPEEILVDLG